MSKILKFDGDPGPMTVKKLIVGRAVAISVDIGCTQMSCEALASQ